MSIVAQFTMAREWRKSYSGSNFKIKSWFGRLLITDTRNLHGWERSRYICYRANLKGDGGLKDYIGEKDRRSIE
jgi:hypothetical protein